MNATAETILISYALLTILGFAVGLIVFRSTRVGFRVKTAGRRTLEKRESLWGLAVITFLVVVIAATMVSLPYWAVNSDASQGKQRIEVVGQQYAWTVAPARAKVGESILVVRSKDVSHGVGVYDPDDTFITQVNVLPGVTQELAVDFDKPGTWTFRCMEYCGVDHHLMRNTLEVTR
jgi:cytochrome c oxidase subunit 2